MTMLQSLDRYYWRMAARGEAEAPGFSRQNISFAVILTPDGDPVQVLDLRNHDGRKSRPAMLDVPSPPKRTIAIAPNFLWDKTAYALGRTAGEGRRTAVEHAAFKRVHIDALRNETDTGLSALRRFLERWDPALFDAAPFTTEMLDTNVVFALDGERAYLHEREAAKRLLDARGAGQGARAICLITGVEATPSRLHPTIKAVDRAQSAGAALVSFNLDAFESYGQKQGDNAPTSEAAAFRYGAALNRLLDRGTSRNRLRISDATVVFWADASGGVDEAAAGAAESMFAAMFAEIRPSEDDAGETSKIWNALRAVAAGRPIAELGLGLMPGTRFHVLGLSPNAARLSVRFWLDDRFEAFAARLARHHADLALEPPPWRDARPPSIQRLLARTTALQEETENIPPLLAGEVARAVLGGTPYPRTLLAAAIIRLRAGDDPGRGWHAAVIKAVINRRPRNLPDAQDVPVALDRDNPNAAYQLGRLFALLQAAQYAALGRVNASIADRYYASASATPARVFASLLRGLQNHLADARRRGLGRWIEPKITDIINRLPSDLPKALSLEDQGRFAVGYYHERASRPPRAAEEPEAADEDADRE